MTCIARMLFCILLLVLFNLELQAASLDDTVRQAVASSPAIGEAESNKAAADQDVIQARGLFLPKVDLEASTGPQWADKPRSLPASSNRTWSDARQAVLVLRQTLFDGFARDSELLRQKSRLDGAISRVLEQTDAVALAATEAHIDVVRQRQVLRAADANVTAHRAIQRDVEARYAGGGAPVSELEQIRERVAAADGGRGAFRPALAHPAAE
jgi:outer membrane protein, adhesin transport system